jgi:hypothetical protein
MKRTARCLLGVLAALALTLGPGSVARAGSPADLVPEATGGAVHVGFGVSPLRWQPLVEPAAGVHGSESGRPADPDPAGKVLSFDLRLRWPGAEGVSRLEPYLAVGPALFVVEPDPVGRLLGTRVDPSLHLGARAGAGVEWRVGRRATLFGGWEVTSPAAGPLDAAGARGAEGALGGHDFTYGLRVTF